MCSDSHIYIKSFIFRGSGSEREVNGDESATSDAMARATGQVLDCQTYRGGLVAYTFGGKLANCPQ